jgi:hypothetical protein
VAPECGQPLSELIDGPCSLATGRSRGCTPGVTPRTVTPDVFDEVRALLAVIDARAAGESLERLCVRRR